MCWNIFILIWKFPNCFKRFLQPHHTLKNVFHLGCSTWHTAFTKLIFYVYGIFSALNFGTRIVGLECKESKGCAPSALQFARISPLSEIFDIIQSKGIVKIIEFRLTCTASDLEPFLEGLSLAGALDKNKIFIVDLEILDGVHCQEYLAKVFFDAVLYFA